VFPGRLEGGDRVERRAEELPRRLPAVREVGLVEGAEEFAVVGDREGVARPAEGDEAAVEGDRVGPVAEEGEPRVGLDDGRAEGDREGAGGRGDDRLHRQELCRVGGHEVHALLPQVPSGFLEELAERRCVRQGGREEAGGGALHAVGGDVGEGDGEDLDAIADVVDVRRGVVLPQVRLEADQGPLDLVAGVERRRGGGEVVQGLLAGGVGVGQHGNAGGQVRRRVRGGQDVGDGDGDLLGRRCRVAGDGVVDRRVALADGVVRACEPAEVQASLDARLGVVLGPGAGAAPWGEALEEPPVVGGDGLCVREGAGALEGPRGGRT
jgi:hypothetical protein